MKRRCTSNLTYNTPDSVKDGTNGGAIKFRKVQTMLAFPSMSSESSSKMSTCAVCGMTFYSYVAKDKEMHNKYHKSFLSGISWPSSLPNKQLELFTVKKEVPRGKKIGSIKAKQTEMKTFTAAIITIDKKSARQVKKVEEVLKMVNQELNAPGESRSWMDGTNDSSKVFLIIIDNKVVGICSTDKITNVEDQCRWMVFSSQMIVPKQVNRQIKLGISRIWIAPSWRGLKLSPRLLEAVLKYSIYGITLSRAEVGFSQPSHSGSLLAKSFNGIKHKSGEILLPVYLE